MAMLTFLATDAGRPMKSGESHGKYFSRAGWMLFPHLPRVTASLFRMTRKFGAVEERHAPANLGKRPQAGKEIDRDEGVSVESQIKELDEEVQRLVSFVKDTYPTQYNCQPTWSLSDFALTNSLDEAKQIVGEFLELAELATDEFNWALAPVGQSLLDLKRHCWKHASFGVIQQLLKNIEVFLPPEARLDLLGSAEGARELYRQAELCNPEAVARVNFVFPDERDRRRAAKYLFEELEPREPIPVIRSVASLAAMYADLAIRGPDSPEAEGSRDALRRLVSRKAAKGSAPQGGRPPMTHHASTIALIHLISYGLAKQINEVHRFLERSLPHTPAKAKPLTGGFYPWLSKPPINLTIDDVLRRKVSKLACVIAGHALDLSPSKIEKSIYPALPI
jgi:hypothetical protein